MYTTSFPINFERANILKKLINPKTQEIRYVVSFAGSTVVVKRFTATKFYVKLCDTPVSEQMQEWRTQTPERVDMLDFVWVRGALLLLTKFTTPQISYATSYDDNGEKHAFMISRPHSPLEYVWAILKESGDYRSLKVFSPFFEIGRMVQILQPQPKEFPKTWISFLGSYFMTHLGLPHMSVVDSEEAARIIFSKPIFVSGRSGAGKSYIAEKYDLVDLDTIGARTIDAYTQRESWDIDISVLKRSLAHNSLTRAVGSATNIELVKLLYAANEINTMILVPDHEGFKTMQKAKYDSRVGKDDVPAAWLEEWLDLSNISLEAYNQTIRDAVAYTCVPGYLYIYQTEISGKIAGWHKTAK